MKWLALASMFVDHIGRQLLGHPQTGWVFAVGRVAFPLFALVLGLNLARTGDRPGRSARTAVRLAGWCAVSVVPSILARGDPQVVNVMATLGLGAAVCWALDAHAPLPARLATCVVAALAAQFVEFGVAGAFLPAGIYLAATRREPGLLLLSAVLLAAVAWLNGTYGGVWAWVGTCAGVLLAVLLRRAALGVPRLKWWFYAVYPVHLAIIGAIKRLG